LEAKGRMQETSLRSKLRRNSQGDDDNDDKDDNDDEFDDSADGSLSSCSTNESLLRSDDFDNDDEKLIQDVDGLLLW